MSFLVAGNEPVLLLTVSGDALNRASSTPFQTRNGQEVTGILDLTFSGENRTKLMRLVITKFRPKQAGKQRGN